MNKKKSRKIILTKVLSLFMVSSLVGVPLISCGPQSSNSSSNVDNNDSDKGSNNENNDNSNDSGNNSSNENNNSNTGNDETENNGNSGNDENSTDNNGNNGSGNNENATDNNTDNNDSNNNENTDNNDNSTNIETTVPQEVLESIDFLGNVYKVVEANQKSLSSNVNEFLSNSNYTNFKGDKTKLQKDMLIYFYELSKKYRNLRISNIQFSTIDVDSNNPNKNSMYTSQNDVILNDSLISFSIEASISSVFTQTIALGSKSVSLRKGKTYTLKISSDRQLIQPQITNYNDLNYLTWNLNSVTFGFNNDSWTESNFVFNSKYCSHTFLYRINNLISGYSYFGLKKQYENEVYNDTNLISNVQTKISDQMNLYSSYFDTARDVLNALRQDISAVKMVRIVSPTIIDLLVNLKIVPSNLESFLLESLYGSSSYDGEFSNIPFIKATYNNKESVAEFISSVFKIADKDLIVTLLSFVEQGITQKVFDESFKPLLTQMGLTDNVIKIIAGDILGISGYGSAKPLVEIFVDNYKLIFKLIQDFTGVKNTQFDGIEAILNILFTKIDSNTYITVYDALLANSSTKQKFLDALKSLVSINSQTEKILKILIVDNNLINKDNIQNIINSLYNFVDGYFARNENYTDITNKYKNLTVKKIINQNVKIDGSKKTIDFDYVYSFSLKNKLELDITPLKNLISDSSVNDLLNYLVEEYKVDKSYINMAIQYVGLSKIKEIVLQIIPSKLEFGTTQNDLTFRFTATQKTPWFDVVKINNTQFSPGISFTFNTNISFNDLGFIDSITKQFQQGMTRVYDYILIVSWASFWVGYSRFWSGIIENILYRDYDINSKMSIVTDDVIANTTNYEEQQYYYDYYFTNNINTNNTDKYVKSILSDDTEQLYENTYNKYDKNHMYQWSLGDGINQIIGNKPYMAKNWYNLIRDRLFTFSDSLTNYELSIIPTFNFKTTLPISIRSIVAQNTDINITLEVLSVDVKLYFPFYIYDNTTKTYVNSIVTNISYFSSNVKMKTYNR